MRRVLPYVQAAAAVFAIAPFSATFADAPKPITADDAFDAVQMQVFPQTNIRASVVLVDVRDPLEYFSSGAAAEVTKIHFVNEKKAAVEPELGKVRLIHEGKFLEYRVNDRYERTQVAKVGSLDTKALAYNVPFWRRNTSGWDKTSEGAFYEAIAEDFAPYYDVLILYCRTGGRSSLAGEGVIERGLFPADSVYEIDDPVPGPDGKTKNGYGGFSGPTFGNAYNGYAGFPGRLTPPDPTSADHASVSWLDSGLPIVTTQIPAP